MLRVLVSEANKTRERGRAGVLPALLRVYSWWMDPSSGTQWAQLPGFPIPNK